MCQSTPVLLLWQHQESMKRYESNAKNYATNDSLWDFGDTGGSQILSLVALSLLPVLS